MATANASLRSHPLGSIERRFVGEVDLHQSEEPLLKENQHCFVLFPIRFSEVSVPAHKVPLLSFLLVENLSIDR